MWRSGNWGSWKNVLEKVQEKAIGEWRNVAKSSQGISEVTVKYNIFLFRKLVPFTLEHQIN